MRLWRTYKRGNPITRVTPWEVDYNNSIREFQKSQEEADRIISEEKAFIMEFEEAVSKALKIGPELLEQYIKFKTCGTRKTDARHYSYNLVTSWRLKGISFREYFEERYGFQVEYFALMTWARRQIVVSPQQIMAIRQKDFYVMNRIGDKTYLINYKDMFLKFYEDEFNKDERSDNGKIILKSLSILLKETSEQKFKRRYLEWDYLNSKYQTYKISVEKS